MNPRLRRQCLPAVTLAMTLSNCGGRGEQADADRLLDRAKQMLEQAEETAERLGGGLVTQELAESRSALAAISG